MTSREALNDLRERIIHPEYFGYREILDELAIIEKDLDDLEKYEKALEIIAKKLNPSAFKQNGWYYLEIPHAYKTNSLFLLNEEEGKVLFELFGGTNYDTK